MNCASCERPLDCDACARPYNPEGLEQYLALSRPEVPIVCPACGKILVCRYCKFPYDGVVDEEDQAD